MWQHDKIGRYIWLCPSYLLRCQLKQKKIGCSLLSLEIEISSILWSLAFWYKYYGWEGMRAERSTLWLSWWTIGMGIGSFPESPPLDLFSSLFAYKLLGNRSTPTSLCSLGLYKLKNNEKSPCAWAEAAVWEGWGPGNKIDYSIHIAPTENFIQERGGGDGDNFQLLWWNHKSYASSVNALMMAVPFRVIQMASYVGVL